MAAAGGPEGRARGCGGGGGGSGGAFACNICLEPAREPVIGRCGHLYCWPCLHQWLQRRPRCAACGAGISRDSVVPLYGRDSARRDPRTETPPRPRGQRPEPETHEVPPQGPPSGFHVTFGFGAFPFSAPPPATGGVGTPPPGSLDSVFLFVAAAFFLWLLSV